MLVAVALFPGRVRHLDATPFRALSSYLFIPTLRADGVGVPVLALGWTLNYEMFFYAAYALALLAPKRIGLALLASGFALLAAVSALVPADQAQLQFWTHPIILEFLFGAGLAILFRHRPRRLGPALSIGLVLAGFALLALTSPIILAPRPITDRQLARPFLAGLPALLVAGGLILGPTIGGRLGGSLARGGDASYAIYLSHPFALNVLAIAWTAGRLPPNGWLYLVAGFGLCIAVGLAVHLGLEAPLLALLRRRFEPRRGSLAA
jgi:peptidoglycan/LPS O-acetylase OafA/YrhL